MSRVIVYEGALYITVLAQNERDESLWRKKLESNKNFESVITGGAGEYEPLGGLPIPPAFKYAVRAKKSSVWFSDEWPFRAGFGIAIRKTV